MNLIYGKSEKGVVNSTVYIACYKSLFAVMSRFKTWSYELDKQAAGLVINEFTAKEVPFRTTIDIFEDLPGDEVEVIGPCNSRVVFKLQDKEFHILNFNTHLIQNWYAEKISKSLNTRGIESRVELVGSYARERSYVNSIIKDVEIIAVKPEKIKAEAKTDPVQLTLIDMSMVTAPSYRRR